MEAFDQTNILQRLSNINNDCDMDSNVRHAQNEQHKFAKLSKNQQIPLNRKCKIFNPNPTRKIFFKPKPDPNLKENSFFNPKPDPNSKKFYGSIFKSAYNIRFAIDYKDNFYQVFVKIRFSSRLGSSKFQNFSEKKLVFKPEPDPNKKLETRKPTRTEIKLVFKPGFESGRSGFFRFG